MAELDIGKHCSVKTCKQLDFLPFTCSGCSKIFCLEHRSMDVHQCSKCNISDEKPEFQGPKSYKCSFEHCNAKELLPIICEHCQMQVCLSHRHQVDHRCSKYEAPTEKMTKTSEHVRQIIDSKKDKSPLKKGPSGVKSKKTAAKVALMKMKMHAVGDKGLPQNERLYFEIFLPLGHSVRSQSMFFSKVWTIGKTIDKIAELAKLKNNNNIVTAQKLRIFDENGCIILPLEQSLDRLIESEVFHSGGSVIIEYVDDSCAKLENIESYSSR